MCTVIGSEIVIVTEEQDLEARISQKETQNTQQLLRSTGGTNTKPIR